MVGYNLMASPDPTEKAESTKLEIQKAPAWASRECEVCGHNDGADCKHSVCKEGFYILKPCFRCYQWGDHLSHECPYYPKREVSRLPDFDVAILEACKVTLPVGKAFGGSRSVRAAAPEQESNEAAAVASKRDASEELEGGSAKRLALDPWSGADQPPTGEPENQRVELLI